MNNLLTLNITTRSPLSHISETISIGSLLNERPIVQGNGDLVNVFCYNANALRGQLRDNMALYLIDQLHIEALSVQIHNFLFSGGKIGGQSKFKLDNIRKHFELLPHFALMGGCLDNMMLPGKLSVFDALPVCQEAMTELPTELHKKAVERTYRRMTIEREFTRMDDSKNMKLSKTLNINPDAEKETVQMRAGGELLNSGVELFSRLLLKDCTELELGALCSGLVKFSEYPFIGGQHNKGHGKVDLTLTLDEEVFYSITDFNETTSERFKQLLTQYDAYLATNKDAIIELLS